MRDAFVGGFLQCEVFIPIAIYNAPYNVSLRTVELLDAVIAIRSQVDEVALCNVVVVAV